jgi:hypothetical protein
MDSKDEKWAPYQRGTSDPGDRLRNVYSLILGVHTYAGSGVQWGGHQAGSRETRELVLIRLVAR